MAMVDYDDPANRGRALARAHKWVAELFKPQNFSAIMKSVDPAGGGNTGQAAFTAACQNAGLDPTEITWLWAYLKECKHALYDPIPEAATSGW